MTLAETLQVIRRCKGKPYAWLAKHQANLKKAIGTIYDAPGADDDLLDAREVEYRLYRKW